MEGHIDPDRARFGKFKELPREGAIHMLNLVRLNEVAKYEDGFSCSGKDAYAAYGRESGPIFAKLGGKIIWRGNFDLTLIGPQNETWDICFIAEYPNAEAFIAMIRDPEYQKAVRHRQAAVKDSRLIRTAPQAIKGTEFG